MHVCKCKFDRSEREKRTSVKFVEEGEEGARGEGESRETKK